MKLENKVAIVTGASSGMGRGIALCFAKEGATVIAVARRKNKLDELVAEAAGCAGTIVAYEADMSVETMAEGVVDDTVKQYGKIDILVNNAGIADNNKPMGEVDDELWNKVMAINVNAVMYASRRAINYMLEAGSGNIINISSGGGLMGCRAGVAYTASKHAVVGITKNTGFMYAQKNIRCNAICPGGVESEISLMGKGFENMSAFGASRCGLYNNTVPRMGTAEEIGKIAVFLASDDSSYINGAAIACDAGWVAG